MTASPPPDPAIPSGAPLAPALRRVRTDGVPVAAAVRALDAMGIGDSWVVAKRIRAAYERGVDYIDLSEFRSGQFNSRFRNLVIGRIGEELFERHCLKPLASAGYEVVDVRGEHSKVDYVLIKEEPSAGRKPDVRHELPINVKVVGTRFSEAKKIVGIDPDDCVSFSATNALGAADQKNGTDPDLLFAQLMEFGLRQRVDGYMSRISGDAGIVWQLLSAHGGRNVESAQDEFVDALFAATEHGDKLVSLSAGAKNFRVIPARDVVQILEKNRERVPQLTGKAGGSVQINVRASDEMVAWTVVSSKLKTVGIRSVLTEIRAGSLTKQAPEKGLAA